jgi:hypothetical protein
MSNALAKRPPLPRRDARTPSQAGCDSRRQTALGLALILGRYQGDAENRELLSIDRQNAGTLVLDVRAGSLKDARVLAVLSREEPPENAALLVQMYLSDHTRGGCRPLDQEDLSVPVTLGTDDGCQRTPSPLVVEGRGARFEIAALIDQDGRQELRWTRVHLTGARAGPAITLRGVVGTLEEYEPARSMSATVIDARGQQHVGVTSLTRELARLLRSPVVLNRALREAVARQVLAGTTMSEIAIRCGRFKRDRRGNRSGETSWLGRRIGQMPEGGQAHPTPWIHSDTLALIARDGLGLSPREVEL